MSMLSEQERELRWLADHLSGHERNVDEYIYAMRRAADTINYLGMVGAENAALRDAMAELWPRASLTMRPDARAEWEERLREMGVEP